MRRPRSMEISTFTIIKGSLIPATYAAFRAWDFEENDDENFERFKRANLIGAKSESWLRDVIKVIHRRFAPRRDDRALVILAQAQCPMVSRSRPSDPSGSRQPSKPSTKF